MKDYNLYIITIYILLRKFHIFKVKVSRPILLPEKTGGYFQFLNATWHYRTVGHEYSKSPFPLGFIDGQFDVLVNSTCCKVMKIYHIK